MTKGLILDNLSHFYGDTAVVREVSLAVAPGELLCLLGPSGCGKTTTLRIAAGLEEVRHGRVTLDGRLVSGDGVHIPPEHRHVGFLFQDYALFPHLNVCGNVEFGLDSLTRPARRQRALEMLTQVGMADYAGAWPHQLSGGQQQRVGLARALAPQPGLMLLDEPFSGLDKRLRDQIRDETQRVLKANGVATLMVTHDPEEAMFMADRIAIMRDGRVVQMDRPSELYGRPADAFVAAFFGEVNVLTAKVRGTAVDTPLGRFLASDLVDGAAAQVIVRPEGITPRPDPQGTATVRAVRPLGATTLVHLAVEIGDAAPVELRCRLPGGAQPGAPLPGAPLLGEGDRVSLEVAPDKVFVFPG